MPTPRSVVSAGGGPYLKRSRYLVLTVMCCALLLIPYVVIRAIHVDREMYSTNLEVTDNETWVVSQLEVDFLKLALSAEKLELSGADGGSAVLDHLPDVNVRFDIFYSRLGTIASKLRGWAEGAGNWDKSLQVLDRLLVDRSRIADILDEASKPGGKLDPAELEKVLAETASDVRNLNISTLSNLSMRTADRRQHYLVELRSLLIQTISMLLVMALSSAVAFVLYRQIGERAAAEHRLSENLFRVFDAKPGAILLTSSDYRIMGMNKAAVDLFGIAESDAEGLHALDRFFPGVARKQRYGGAHPLVAHEASNGPTRFRDIVRTATGLPVPAEVTRIRLMAESGEDTIVFFVRDISQTQHALRALRRERRMAEAESGRYQRFLAVMSHEIRSPLHAIIASLDLAQQRPQAAAMADLHGIALDAAQIALDEADAVLAIGRAEHEMHVAEPVVFSPSGIVRDLVEMNGPAAQAAGNTLAFDIDPAAEGYVLGLRACFWHAVSNLVGNAVKFTRNGTVRVRIRQADDVFRVEVVDDGPGIAPELQAIVFRDHYTRDPLPGGRGKGAGLGLGLFVTAVEAMSGEFGLDSQPGKGSTFWFTFRAPAAERPAANPVSDASATTPLPQKLRVLVVDDSQVNRTLIKQMFDVLGLATDLSSSGAEAVAAAQVKDYQLILMDLSMPDMDGFAAAAAIRQTGRSRQARIIALTANSLARAEVDKPDSDFDGLWLKPLRLDELRHALATGSFEPREEPAGPPVIERGIARDLMDMLPPSSIRPLLTTLFDEALDLAGAMDRAAPDATLTARFHRIAGSAGMLGAERLRALALDGENGCAAGGTVPNSAFCATWKQTVADTSQEWSALLAGRPEPVAAAIER